MSSNGCRIEDFRLLLRTDSPVESVRALHRRTRVQVFLSKPSLHHAVRYWGILGVLPKTRERFPTLLQHFSERGRLALAPMLRLLAQARPVHSLNPAGARGETLTPHLAVFLHARKPHPWRCADPTVSHRGRESYDIPGQPRPTDRV